MEGDSTVALTALFPLCGEPGKVRPRDLQYGAPAQERPRPRSILRQGPSQP